MADGVEMEVDKRIAHRSDVADLAGEVEDDVCVGDHIGGRGLADLCVDDARRRVLRRCGGRRRALPPTRR